MKKVLSFLLAFSFILSLIPSQVVVAESPFTIFLDKAKFYQEIIKKISELSTKPKLIAFEIGMTQGNELLEFSKKHLSRMTSSIEKDLTGRDRYLFIERV